MGFQPPLNPTGPMTMGNPVPQAPTPGMAPLMPGFQIEGARRQILGAIWARKVTDNQLSPLWTIIPALVGIVGGAMGFVLIVSSLFSWVSNYAGGVSTNPFAIISFGYLVLVASLIASFALVAVLTHQLIERQDEHFQREAQLRMGILSFLRSAAGSPEREATIAIELATISTLNNQALYEERPHNALAWAIMVAGGGILFVFTFILGVIGLILGLYMFSFLMNNMAAHDNRWNMLAQQTGSALQKLGYNTNPAHWNTVRLENRSFGLYTVLTIITLGLFVFYWLYILIKDPNEHFARQAYVENNLAYLIKQ